ncbi:MAG: DUF58 domain-containing protein [Candidatus Hodarchaeota archaeon]
MRTWILTGIILPLLIIFFFSLTSKEVFIDLKIKRSISRNKTEEKGELIYVHLVVQNIGKRIPFLNIVDEVPDVCTINEGSNHWTLELDQGEEITLSYAIRCHKRGRYTLGPVFVRGSDIFHFNSKLEKYKVFNSFSVVPSLIKLRNLPIYRHRLLPETGNVPSLTYKGRDFDFQGVRDYQTGDEVRSINWRVTAKFNKLATNEYALDQAARVFIIFDHTTSANRVLEEGVMAALSSSEYLLSQRNKIGFFGLGEFVEEIPAATGKRQLLRINEYLIDAKGSYPNSDTVFNLRLIRKLLPSLPPFSQIFFISPLYNRMVTKFLGELATQGHDIILIMPRLENPSEEQPLVPKASVIANALLILDRAHVFNYIAKLGIIQIHWYPYGPKYETIKVRRTK